MKKCPLITLLALLILSTSVTAAPQFDDSENNAPNRFSVFLQKWQLQPYASVNMGFGAVYVNASANYDVAPGQVNFIAKNGWQKSNIVGLNIGLEHPFAFRNKKFIWQIGLGLEHFSAITATGTLVQGLPGELDHYNYSYDMSSLAILLENKLGVVMNDIWQPYFLVGVGRTINQANDYTAITQDSSAFIPVTFSDKTTNNAAYEIGAGIDVIVTPQMRAGVSYRYFNLGAAPLGDGSVEVPGASTPFSAGTLKQSSLVLHSILFGFAYFF